MKTVKEVARMRDGGSLLVECEGIRYFYDQGIGSETRGELFYHNTFNNKHTLRFARVPEPEQALIISAIKKQILLKEKDDDCHSNHGDRHSGWSV